MPDREKVTGHLNDCLATSRLDNLWVFVRKDIVSDALALLKEQTRWISVKDRLPDDASDILAYYDDGTENRIVPANYYKGCWYDCVFNRPVNDLETGFIGYWMSLPNPPEGVTQDG